MLTKLISGPAETASTYLESTFPGASRNIKSNYNLLTNKFNDNFTKFNETYPYISNTTTALTTTFNDGTEYIYSIPSSIGSTVNSYTNMFQPVDLDEREVTRTPPNANLIEGVQSLSDARQELVSNILDLYSLNLKVEYFRHYDENVIFSDPLMYTVGLENLKAQFWGMPKLFTKSSTDKYKILENSTGTIKIDLHQKYVIPFVKRAVVQNTVVILEFNQDNKICKHTDLWNGREIGKEGILRKGAAKLVSTLVRVPKN